jgi:hypothetical protein
MIAGVVLCAAAVKIVVRLLGAPAGKWAYQNCVKLSCAFAGCVQFMICAVADASGV